MYEQRISMGGIHVLYMLLAPPLSSLAFTRPLTHSLNDV